MDNGLIFPYRRRTAHANPLILTTRNLPEITSVIVVGVAWELKRSSERINRCDAGR